MNGIWERLSISWSLRTGNWSWGFALWRLLQPLVWRSTMGVQWDSRSAQGSSPVMSASCLKVSQVRGHVEKKACMAVHAVLGC